ncbi:cytidylyltransferase domain-containing protein [Cupriavidus basilensis]|uniref:Surface polysaccharide biosynthesis protein, possible cytidylyltransferase n=1 Tax=Cupriavidus basilensis TaxID=68895 RepID=A0A0C4YIR2_9BURK|nr:glycosyltransferase family protein [Cupriavidus basilensis]AJG20586.1 Surface polysaccharide biosynthesis protein, possible cytidylyltransferase [Cupriavidus basilensis]
MTVMALLQARSSSTRLPGKVLKPLLGEPMILRQIERLRRSRKIDRLMVVTSDNSSDDELAACCVEAGVEVFRGSLDDVLDRFYSAVKDIRPQHVVRLTADCPLADPEVIDAVIDFYRDGDFDYASNVLEPTYPDGLDAEVFRFGVLETIWQEASLASQREHVTSFIYQHPERFRLGCLKRESDLSALRWTVDEPSDLEFVTAVYGALYRDNPAFLMADVLRLLAQRPELIEINAGQLRNAGYVKSLVQDELLPRRV